MGNRLRRGFQRFGATSDVPPAGTIFGIRSGTSGRYVKPGPPRQPLMAVEGTGLRRTLPVELSSVDRLHEALPRLGGEAQHRSGTVLAVADLDGAVNLPNLHAGTVLPAPAALPPRLVDRRQRVSPRVGHASSSQVLSIFCRDSLGLSAAALMWSNTS